MPLPASRIARRSSRSAAIRLALSAAALAAAVVLATPLSATAASHGDGGGRGVSAHERQVLAEGIGTFRAPADLGFDDDVAYGGGNGQTLDVCTPAGDATAPRAVVLEIHGGAWRAGDKSGPAYRDVCDWLATSGFVAFDVDYRLAPGAVFPAQLTDVQAALSWIRRPAQLARYDIDPARVGILGGSAGANLSTLLAQSVASSASGHVQALVDLSGPVDLVDGGQRLAPTSPWLQQAELEYLGCTDFAHCPAADRASALEHVSADDPPTLIAGSANELVPFAQDSAFAAALGHAGVAHQVIEEPGSRHSVAMLDAGLRARVAAFLHAHLG